jgi:hypothetical protein
MLLGHQPLPDVLHVRHTLQALLPMPMHLHLLLCMMLWLVLVPVCMLL